MVQNWNGPKFNNSTFLNNPDIFTLEYKRGQNDLDILDTVNRFGPSGLALRTIQVDYVQMDLGLHIKILNQSHSE